MKNRLLPLFVVLGCYTGYSQVGIGTLTPKSSRQKKDIFLLTEVEMMIFILS